MSATRVGSILAHQLTPGRSATFLKVWWVTERAIVQGLATMRLVMILRVNLAGVQLLVVKNWC